MQDPKHISEIVTSSSFVLPRTGSIGLFDCRIFWVLSSEDTVTLHAEGSAEDLEDLSFFMPHIHTEYKGIPDRAFRFGAVVVSTDTWLATLDYSGQQPSQPQPQGR